MKIVSRLILAALAAAVLLHGCAMTPRYDGAPSDHFDGLRFFNAEPADKTIFDILGLVSTFWLRKEAWPDWVENGTYAPAPVAPDGIVVTYINHSTVLLTLDGINILTDPIWGERASPFSFAGPKRVREPGLAVADLPPLDVILISHDHYDHLDVETLEVLMQRGRDGEPPLVLSGLGTDDVLQRHAVTRLETLDWGDRVKVGDVEIIFAEVRHRSGRGLGDQMKTLWGGFVIRAARGSIYFAGDTGYGRHFAAARQTYGAFRLALIPIGAYRPRSFMAPVHLDPQHAVRAHQDLSSQQSVAVHHGTFQLTYEGIDEPYQELAMALDAAGIEPARFRVLGFGESLVVPWDGTAEDGALVQATP